MCVCVKSGLLGKRLFGGYLRTLTPVRGMPPRKHSPNTFLIPIGKLTKIILVIT